MTPLCGQKSHWNEESCDLMPLPYDYGVSSSMNPPKAIEPSSQVSSSMKGKCEGMTTTMKVGPPVYYYSDLDQELYLCSMDGQHPYIQQTFSTDSFFHNDCYGTYFPESTGPQVTAQGDPKNSTFLTFV